MAVTQIINHATPAGFSVHNPHRYNYGAIAKSQVEAQYIDLMLGGGDRYFSSLRSQMQSKNVEYINNISELESINNEKRVIGALAYESTAQVEDQTQRTGLADMTEASLSRLENDNGFFLMIEGSDIDSYSHYLNMDGMLREIIGFDNAVKVAMDYVDSHPDTLLIVTADHETGGLNLNGITSKEQLTNDLFTARGRSSVTGNLERNSY